MVPSSRAVPSSSMNELWLKTQYTKLWDTHGRIYRKFNDRRYRIQADAGHFLTRNKKFIKLSARAGNEPPDEPPDELMQANAPPPEVVITTGKKPAPVVPARRESSKRTKKRPRRYLE